MSTLSQITWLTLMGLSLFFVGGFVLWVYGARQAEENEAPQISGPEAAAARNLHTNLVQWFLLYGAVISFAGVGCLLTAAAMVM